MINPHGHEQQEPVKGDDHDLEEFICEACGDAGVLPLVDIWKIADQDAIYYARAAKPDHDPDEPEFMVIELIHDVPCCECRPPHYDRWMDRALSERGLPNGMPPTTVEVRALPIPKEDIVPGQMYQLPETIEEGGEVYFAMFPWFSEEQLLKAETEYAAEHNLEYFIVVETEVEDLCFIKVVDGLPTARVNSSQEATAYPIGPAADAALEQVAPHLSRLFRGKNIEARVVAEKKR